MAIYQNHLIDPLYFWDAINEFEFGYDLYVVSKSKTPDEYGKRSLSYSKQLIRGSLQSAGTRLNQSKDGSTNDKQYDFYCKSLYRIDIGDIIDYKGNYLMCDSVHDYDEHGVRSAHLSMIKLTAHRDFADYLKYLRGDKLV